MNVKSVVYNVDTEIKMYTILRPRVYGSHSFAYKFLNVGTWHSYAHRVILNIFRCIFLCFQVILIRGALLSHWFYFRKKQLMRPKHYIKHIYVCACVYLGTDRAVLMQIQEVTVMLILK